MGNADAARAWLAAAEAVGAVELEPGSGAVITGRLNLRRLGNERRLAIEQRARAIERVRWDSSRPIERYADGQACRREPLLRYFGDREPARPLGRCCDVHEPPSGAPRRGPRLEPEELIDAVVEIAATAEPSVGRAGLDGIARGLDAYRDRYGEHPVFGVASGLRPPQVRAAIGAAVARERLASTEGRYPLLLPPGAGPRRAADGQPGRTRRNPRPAAASDMDVDLLDELRAWRRTEAATRAVPAYVVANDRALVDIADAPARRRRRAARVQRRRPHVRLALRRRGAGHDRRPADVTDALRALTRDETGGGTPGRIPDDRECRADSVRARRRRDTRNPAGLDRRPACCRRRANARREHESDRTVTAGAERAREAGGDPLHEPFGPRVPVPDARGVGDDPLATVLYGRRCGRGPAELAAPRPAHAARPGDRA